MHALDRVRELVGGGHGDLGKLGADTRLGVVTDAAHGERTRCLVALDDGHDDRRRAVALVQPRERGRVADKCLFGREGVLIELIAADYRGGHGTAGAVERAPGVAPGVAVIERLDAGIALPQRNHQRRSRHRFGGLDAARGQPALHLIGGEDDGDAGDVAVAHGAIAGEFDAAHHAIEPRIVERRDAAAVLRRDHALDKLLSRLALGLADGLIPRLEGVGGGNVDLDPAHSVGVVARHLSRGAMQSEACREERGEHRGKPAA